MQKVKLPKQLDPFKCAVQRSEYRGVYKSQDMTRFLDSVVACDETVAVDITFKKDEQGLTYFSGSVETSAMLVCERCGGQIAQPLQANFCFSPIRSDAEIEELPETYDPIEVNDQGEINILQVVEDELILQLPIVAFHAEEECGMSQNELSFGDVGTDDEKPNPFAVLKELKQNQE